MGLPKSLGCGILAECGISYTYDSLYRLTAADDSTGECYAYQYDPVGNREMMTDAIGVYTYTYDAANRLANPDGAVYTWDARGNLLTDGTFTYTYNAAGRMIRAASITTTLAYTYTADGLRIAQNIDGAEKTFTWDWATSVPEMLYDGQYTYLVGHDTLAWEGARTPMSPVTAVREWSPYGVEVGGAQAGLGFTFWKNYENTIRCLS